MTDGFNFQGAKADIKVWTPNVEHDDEYSASRIALKTGHYSSYESLESGWAVCYINSAYNLSFLYCS